MRILLVTETLHPGGAETFVVRLANALSRTHDVAIAVLYKHIVNPGVLEQVSAKVKVLYAHVGMLSLKHKADSLLRKMGIDYSLVQSGVINELNRIVNEFKPNLVHSHLFKADYAVAQVAIKSSVAFKHVTTIHGDYSSFYNGEVNPRMLHIRVKMATTLSAIDHIVCLCEEHIGFYQAAFPALLPKVSLIYNGFKPASDDYKKVNRADLNLPEDKKLIGMVSRGVEKKGWKKAIDAFLEANPSNAMLVLVGSGDYLDKLATEINHPAIRFAGYCANPVMYIQHFDICLLPTLFHYESLPTVVMEYLYCNKPVIATNVGEIKKMITADSGMAGDVLDFDQQDVKVAELKHFMLQYLNDQDYFERKKAHTGAAFMKFDMNNCVQSYLSLYQA